MERQCICGITHFGASCRSDRKRKEFCGMLVTIQLHFGEGSSVTFDGLANVTVAIVELHRTFDFEGRRVRRISRNSDEN